MGSLTVLADGMPFSGGGAHLHLDCNDVGIPSVHKVPGMFLPTGVINPIPPARQILTSPVPVPLNPMAALARKCTGAFGRFYKKKTRKLADRLHSKVNRTIKSESLKNMLHKAICTVTGHPVDVASGTFFTDEEDFWLDGRCPCHGSARGTAAATTGVLWATGGTTPTTWASSRTRKRAR